MTIMGLWTVAELRDFVARQDARVSTIGAAFANFRPQWAASNPTEASLFASDWAAFEARYRSARQRAELSLSQAKYLPGSENVQPADPEFKGIITALQSKPGPYTDRDLSGLYRRLEDAKQRLNAPVTTFNLPGTTAGDFDLDVLKSASKATSAIERAAKTVSSAVSPWAIGAGVAVAILATTWVYGGRR
jgi:hypothetical protein